MLTEFEVSTLVEAGGQAPSGGNMQPWRVRVRNSKMELWLDRVRASSFLDVGCLASVFSLGAFAENVVIAARGLGLTVAIEVAHAVGFKHAMVTLQFARDATPRGGVHPLAQWIAARKTNRKPHRGAVIDDMLIEHLRAMVGEVCLFHARSDEADRRFAADILGASDVVRLRNRTLNTEMWDEVRWTPAEVKTTRDGIDVNTLEVPDDALSMLKKLRDHDFVMKHVPDVAIIDMSRTALLETSHICCLSIETTKLPERWFAAGREVQRLWLRATECGLAIQPWTALTFLITRVELFSGEGLSAKERVAIAALDQKLRALFNLPASQLALFVFRLSRADEPSARSLRRPVTDYMTLHSEQ